MTATASSLTPSNRLRPARGRRRRTLPSSSWSSWLVNGSSCEPETENHQRPARGRARAGASGRRGRRGDGQIASNGSGEPSATRPGRDLRRRTTHRMQRPTGPTGQLATAKTGSPSGTPPQGEATARSRPGSTARVPCPAAHSPSRLDVWLRQGKSSLFQDIWPKAATRRRARRRRHGLLRPPPGGPLRPAALPVRSEHSRGQSLRGSRTPG